MWSTRLFRVWLAGRCRLKMSCSRCSGLVKNLVLRNDARNLHMDGNNQALLQLPSTLATAVTSYGSSWGAERPRHLNFDDYGFSGLYRLYPSLQPRHFKFGMVGPSRQQSRRFAGSVLHASAASTMQTFGCSKLCGLLGLQVSSMKPHQLRARR